MTDPKVTPLFPGAPAAGVDPGVDTLVRELREVADELERGERLACGMVVAYRDHLTHTRLLTLGAMTAFEQIGVLNLAHQMALRDLLDP